jgi:mono/diheme cytochrome c family protein
MYALTLFVHSWLRWIVVCAAAFALARASRSLVGARAWTSVDEKLSRVLLGLIDLQFSLGLLLYVFLSPMVQGAFADLKAAMRSAPLRFFAIEHITAMVIAVALAHIGRARLRRASDDRKRHQSALLGSAGFLLMVLVGMPWPFLKHGRPLFRARLLSDGAPSEAASVPEIYARRCAACHGVRGRGDGLAAQAMQPRPRDFSDASWQRTVSDDALRSVILRGGSVRDLSASMPAHPDLNRTQQDALIRFIRSALGARAPEAR